MATAQNHYVYVMTSRSLTLYVGVTNNLDRRAYEHHLLPGFTAKYNIVRLVYFEETSDITSAITREKQIKGWTRNKKKIDLVSSMNPKWHDLSEDWP